MYNVICRLDSYAATKSRNEALRFKIKPKENNKIAIYDHRGHGKILEVVSSQCSLKQKY